MATTCFVKEDVHARVQNVRRCIMIENVCHTVICGRGCFSSLVYTCLTKAFEIEITTKVYLYILLDSTTLVNFGELCNAMVECTQ